MQWITDNWLLLLVVGGMVAMHLFGHRHGRKDARHTSHRETDKEKMIARHVAAKLVEKPVPQLAEKED